MISTVHKESIWNDPFQTQKKYDSFCEVGLRSSSVVVIETNPLIGCLVMTEKGRAMPMAN